MPHLLDGVRSCMPNEEALHSWSALAWQQPKNLPKALMCAHVMQLAFPVLFLLLHKHVVAWQAASTWSVIHDARHGPSEIEAKAASFLPGSRQRLKVSRG